MPVNTALTSSTHIDQPTSSTAMAQGVEEVAERPLKRRRTGTPHSHRLRHVQQTPDHVEPAPQDALFVQSQLLRSLSTALAAVGFDSVLPSALEAFRAETEECRLLRPCLQVLAKHSLQTCFTSSPTFASLCCQLGEYSQFRKTSVLPWQPQKSRLHLFTRTSKSSCPHHFLLLLYFRQLPQSPIHQTSRQCWGAS